MSTSRRIAFALACSVLTPAQADDLAATFKQLSKEATTDAHEEMWYDLGLDADYIAAGEHDPRKGTMHLYIVRDEEGEIAGGLSLAVDSSEEGLPPDTVVLSRMATTGTLPGAGKALLKECCRFAAGRGQGVVAFALPTARGFYSKQGMSSEKWGRLYRVEFTAAQAAAYARG